MPIQISRLRRWLAAAAIAVALVVAGTYFYASHRVQNALNQVPEKIGVEIQQSAQGFTVSKSEQGRTIFKIQASKAVQYKQGGHAQLHDVAITLYGRDASRFDQIYGANFDYDPKTGDVVASGDVQIDLEANPEGIRNADQVPPKELKNPIHLKTRDLVFNQKTGNAYTKAPVEFHIPQASGSATGVTYDADSGVLKLESQVNVQFQGPNPATVTAVRGAITKKPNIVALELAHMESSTQKTKADKAAFFLRPDNTLDRIVATGNVSLENKGAQSTRATADQMDVLMSPGQKETVQNATLSGNVRMQSEGDQPMEGSSDRALLDFVGKNVLSKVRAEGDVKLLQHQKASSGNATAQDLELSARVVDLFVKNGRVMQRAETSGPDPKITIRPTGQATGQQTVVTAGRFEAQFDEQGRPASVHGAPQTRIVTQAAGEGERVSTGDTLDLHFSAGKGLESIVQAGNLSYTDKERKAWADRGTYTPSDHILTLTGSPRVEDGGMTTTARTMRMNRATGDAFAEGDVKSTYSDLKTQPTGALLASSAPIHVTARTMTAHRSPALAQYAGDARLWQDANVVEAPFLDFDRDRRSVTARASSNKRVSTVIVQTDDKGKATPIAITAARLTYTDDERKAHFEGGVVAKGADATITSSVMDVFLQPRGQEPGRNGIGGTGKLDHIVADGQVVITQPSRRGMGEHLVYTVADDKYVLTGGSPSIFDAERGKITGVSLTFFRRDDRVLVEGNNTSPTVTQTRVAR